MIENQTKAKGPWANVNDSIRGSFYFEHLCDLYDAFEGLIKAIVMEML
jgi:hypothetical protein